MASLLKTSHRQPRNISVSFTASFAHLGAAFESLSVSLSCSARLAVFTLSVSKRKRWPLLVELIRQALASPVVLHIT